MEASRGIQGRTTLLAAVLLGLSGFSIHAEPAAPVVPARHGNRIHYVRWCQHCQGWSCSGCNMSCQCPPVVVPGQIPQVPQSFPAPWQSSPSYPQPVPTDGSRGESLPPGAAPPRADGQADPSQLTPQSPLADPGLADSGLTGPGPAPTTPTSQDPSSSLGAGAADLFSQASAPSGLSGTPGMLGDNFGTGQTISVIAETRRISIPAVGHTSQSFGGDPNAVIAFETSSQTSPANDFFSVGIGRDTLPPSGLADEFDISEPVSGSDAPTSPGPEFEFDGGTALNRSGTFDDGDVWHVNYSFTKLVRVVIPNPASSGAVLGRVKIAENTSPYPRDRVFVNYSYFDDVPLTAGGAGVSRFTPGIERTFYHELMSYEFRIPFASTIDPTIIVDSAGATRDLEFGNLYFALKGILWEFGNSALTAGLSMTVPTADDLRVQLVDGTDLVLVENRAVHLLPFLGWIRSRGNRFSQGFLQIDTDVSGNTVRLNRSGAGLEKAGRIRDVTMMYFDWGFGRWIYRAPDYCRGLTGIAPTMEIHYNRSLEASDAFVDGRYQLGQTKERIQQLNVLIGTYVQYGPQVNMSVGYVTPVGNGADSAFDGELRLLINRFF